MDFRFRGLWTAAFALCLSSTAFANPNTPTAANLAKLPMSFEPNRGQADSQFNFLARGSGYTLLLSPAEADLGLRSAANSSTSSTQAKTPGDPSSASVVKAPNPYATLRLRFLGANAAAKIEGLDEQPGVSNYYLGNDPAKWRTNVPHFSRVRYQNLYPGIDIVYYGNQSQLEHDFILAPGADPSKIRLRVDGAEKISLDADGNLLLSVSGGTLHFSKPFIYQQSDAQTKTPVEGRFVRRGRHEIGFRVAAYNRNQSLVIDPILAYASYLGGSGTDTALAVTSDNAGAVYLTGSTTSTDFPVKNAYQATIGGTTTYSPPITTPPYMDAFITKIDTTQSGANSLVYSTFLGGGGVFVPVTVLNGYGQPETVYYTLAGGTNRGTAIAVDASGEAYVAGITSSFNFPIVGGINLYSGGSICTFPPDKGPAPVCVAGAAFVAKFSASGALLYSTDLGGKLGTPDTTNYWGYDYPGVTPTGIAVDHNGITYVAGSTPDFDFPMTANPFHGGFVCLGSCNNLPANGFLTEFDPTKTGSASMIYSTLLYSNTPSGVALDASDDVYLAGSTHDGTAVTPGTFQTSSLTLLLNGYANFIAKFDFTKPGSSALLWGTFFPEAIDSVAVGGDGSTFVSGTTSNSNLPPSPGAFDICAITPAGDTLDTDCNSSPVGGLIESIYVARLNPTATSLTYVARLGGYVEGIDFAIPSTALAVDPNGNAFVTGTALVSYLRPDVPVVTIGSPPPLPPFPPVAVAAFPGNLINGDCLTATPNCYGGAFVSMLNPQGSALIYSYLLTADNNEFGYNTGSFGSAVSADGVGNAYFVGSAYSPAIPVTSNAFQSTLGGTSGVAYNAYVAKIPSDFPEATLSATSVSFGSSALHVTASPQSVTLTNTGYAPLTINGFSIAGPNSSDFVITGNNCPVPTLTLGIGDACIINMTFTPTIAALETATLNVASNAAGTPTPQTTATLTGTGLSTPPPPTNITSSVSFRATGLAYSRVSKIFNGSITVTNTSGGTLTGPFQLVFTALPAGVALLNASGIYNGSPYITLPSITTLAAGQTVTGNLQFTDLSMTTITFTPQVYAGTF